jgi:hypothetical protein
MSLQPAFYAQRRDISKPPDSVTLRLLQQKIVLPGFEDPTAQKVMGKYPIRQPTAYFLSLTQVLLSLVPTVPFLLLLLI